jgi:hypothetical protein
MNSEQQEIVFHITAHYVAEAQAGLQPALSDYIERYPQYADAIADFVAYYQSFEVDSPDTTASDPLSPISQEALTRALQHVSSEPPSTEIIKSLLVIEEQYLTLFTLARKLDLSADIVALLEQRCIDPATLPYELYRRIATVLQQPISSVQAYLSWSPPGDRSDNEGRHSTKVAERRAPYHVLDDQDPGEQSFRHIVRESLWLSPAQRETWETILTMEGL